MVDELTLPSSILGKSKDPTSMRYWLIKFAPFRTSWTQVVQRGRFALRGVRNAQARKNLMAMSAGDPVFFYHSQQERAVVGLLRVERESYPDPTSASAEWVTCDFAPVRQFKTPVTIAMFRRSDALAHCGLIRQPRLAVVSLSKEEFAAILSLEVHAEGTPNLIS